MKSLRIILPAILIITISCKDTIEDLLFSVTASPFTTTMDENPSLGQSIGTLSVSSNGVHVITITTQSPSGAMVVNSLTGELTVANPLAFDYETNPLITALYTATNGAATDTETITINLIDDPTD